MNGEAETPLGAARRYAMDQQAKVDQQKVLIGRLSDIGRSTIKAKRDLAGMEHSLSLLLRRVMRLGELGSAPSP